jgi:hypothetical protein
MLQSQFNLDHRLAELRQVGEDLRIASQLRDSAGQAVRPTRSLGEAVRTWLAGSPAPSRPSRANASTVATR